MMQVRWQQHSGSSHTLSNKRKAPAMQELFPKTGGHCWRFVVRVIDADDTELLCASSGLGRAEAMGKALEMGHVPTSASPRVTQGQLRGANLSALHLQPIAATAALPSLCGLWSAAFAETTSHGTSVLGVPAWDRGGFSLGFTRLWQLSPCKFTRESWGCPASPHRAAPQQSRLEELVFQEFGKITAAFLKRSFCFETPTRLKGNFDYKAFQVLDVPVIMENRA